MNKLCWESKFLVLFFVFAMSIFAIKGYASEKKPSNIISNDYTFIFYWGYSNSQIEPMCSEVTFHTDWMINDYITAYRKAVRERDGIAVTDSLYESKLEQVEQVVAAWEYYLSCLNRFGINSEDSILIDYNEDVQLLYDPALGETYYRNLYWYNVSKKNMLEAEFDFYKIKYPDISPELFEEYKTVLMRAQDDEINKSIFLYEYFMKENAGIYE